MARKPRIEYPGALYHVIARGNQRRDVFHDAADRRRYLAKLAHYKQRYAFRLLAYVLMTNHVHLLVETGTVGLGKNMQGLHQSYTQGYNRRYGAVGHVFQGRYQAILCDRDTYLLALVRYIHLNPVRAGLVSDPEAYPWSGHREYCGPPSTGLLDCDVVLRMLSSRRGVARKQYQAFVHADLEAGSRPEYYRVRDQRILGDDDFMSQVEAQQSERDRPAAPRRTAAELLAVVARATGVPPARIAGRDRAVETVRARRLFLQAGAVAAVPGRDLARTVGRDPAFVSRATRMSGEERSQVEQLVQEVGGDRKSTSQV